MNTITTEKKKCTTWKNSIRVTPPPKYRALLKALSEEIEVDKKVGKAINYAVKQFFDNMPEDQRRRLIERSKNHY